MATEFDLTPPEVPEPTFFDNVLRYGLFLAAIFQIVCILSILLPSKSSEPVCIFMISKQDDLNISKEPVEKIVGLPADLTQEWEQSELKPSDIAKKQKPTTPSSGKKTKKESKKKR